MPVVRSAAVLAMALRCISPEDDGISATPLADKRGHLVSKCLTVWVSSPPGRDLSVPLDQLDNQSSLFLTNDPRKLEVCLIPRRQVYPPLVGFIGGSMGRASSSFCLQGLCG